jgi:hypothetical protein
MLRVTLDVFSGRTNPQYVLEGPEADAVLRDISRNRGVVTDAADGSGVLGFRGAIVELLADDLADGLPSALRVGGPGATDDSKGKEIAERLVRLMEGKPSETDQGAFDGVQDYIAGLLKSSRTTTTPDRHLGAPTAPAAGDVLDVTCQIERSKFNPGFWNAGDVIRLNNCYNYASNWRTNTFAQPGKGAGAQYTALSCAEVTRAALADGCHRRYDCFPESEKNRWLMALVVAPGRDYHWYRSHTLAEGFWGHKPGGTQARNIDNSGRVIVNPETADRGPYTHFCGYFYSCRTQQSRIR